MYTQNRLQKPEKSKRAPSGALLNGLFHVETLLEAVNASAGIDQLLLASVEGVALGANFDLQFTLHRTRLKRLTAHATDDGLAIFGMDLFFHALSPLLRMLWVGFRTARKIIA